MLGGVVIVESLGISMWGAVDVEMYWLRTITVHCRGTWPTFCRMGEDVELLRNAADFWLAWCWVLLGDELALGGMSDARRVV